MDNAVVAKPPLPLVEELTFAGRMAAMPLRSKLSLGLGLMALAGVVLAMTLWSSKGDYRVLYTNLSDKDGGAVIAQLSQMNVPYRMEGGNVIKVPAGQVDELRLRLATAGLPKGTIAGYEIMDAARFGQTQFQERLTAQRGLEGELTRSIGSLAAVESARVHLALPNQNGFFREQQKPSASVLLNLHAGRTLDRAQVAGIVHLVSSSVPELDPKAVSVLDQTGALLTNADANGTAAGLDAQQLQYIAQIENGYARRIADLLEPLVGRDNLRATVTADIDFAQSEATSEEFRPNQGSDAQIVIRSQQTSEQTGSTGAQPSGIPGAASNQPPAAAAAPLSGASQPLQAAQSGSGTGTGRREATTNYEIDKTVRVTRNATGNIRRLNAAVVVNDRTTTDAKGKTKPAPLPPEEIEKITALVQQGIGFKKERGDSVKVINAPFKIEPVTTIDIPLWKQPEVIDLLRSLAVPGGLGLVAMLVFFGMVKPAMKIALAPPPPPEPGANLTEVVDDAQELPPMEALPPPRRENQLEAAKRMARENPAAVASIVRGWVSGEPVAAKG